MNLGQREEQGSMKGDAGGDDTGREARTAQRVDQAQRMEDLKEKRQIRTENNYKKIRAGVY